MNAKYLKGLLGLATMAILTPESDPFHTTRGDDSILEKLNKPVSKVIPAGCKEYTIEGITVVAISEKSARKKVAKRKEATHE